MMNVDHESDSEVTVNLADVIRQVRELETARAAADKRAALATAKQKSTPLPWSAAWVLMVFALCVALGWVAYLAYA